MTLRELLSKMNSNPFESVTPKLLVRDDEWAEEELALLAPGQVYASIYGLGEREPYEHYRSRDIVVRLFQKPDVTTTNTGQKITKRPSKETMDVLYHFLITKTWHTNDEIRPPVVAVNDNESVNSRTDKGAYKVELKLSSPCMPPSRSLSKPFYLEATVSYRMTYFQW